MHWFRFHRMWSALAVAGLFAACEKVISIDLNSTDPQIVVEGVVKDQPGPYAVFLRRTGDYFASAPMLPAVNGARVVVSDDHGAIDTLKEVQAGMYESSTMQGMERRQYRLQVEAAGKRYQGASTMPAKVRMDSLYAQARKQSGGGYDIYLVYTDPPETPNYYRINVRSGTRVPADSIDGRRYRLLSDKLVNGTVVKGRIRTGGNLRPGDTVTVELLSIDKPMYDYFSSLRDALSSDRSPTSLSPANPITNLDNGALGYFGAWAIDRKSIILQ